MGIRRDFVVESEGHCFFCWSESIKATELKPNPSSVSVYSLQCLSRYLRMDMRKVFSEESPIPQQLLVQVQESNLKVELCEKCAALSKQFIRLYRNLEKIEMEVVTCLEFIHGKLKGAETGRAENSNWKERNPEHGLINKLEIAKVLRKEAALKCSIKMGASSPRVRAQKLTPNELNTEKLKIKSKPRKTNNAFDEKRKMVRDSRKENYMIEIEMRDDIKSEGLNSPLDDDTMGVLAGDDDMDASLDMEEEVDVSEESASELGRQREGMKMARSIGRAQHSQDVPLPIKIGPIEDGKSQCKFVPETGKYECLICSRDFAAQKSFRVHYLSVHLKVKHECKLCGKAFSQQAHYHTHYLKAHIGVRYKCNQCYKIFVNKSKLTEHQQSSHLGKRFPCQFCSKTFARSGDRAKHMKTNCDRTPR